MNRSMQEIVELVIFALIALLVGTGLVWVAGWLLELVGFVFQWLAALVWSLLRFVVPVAIVAVAVYALVKVLQGRDRRRDEASRAETESATPTGDGTTGSANTAGTAAATGAAASAPSSEATSEPAAPEPAASDRSASDPAEGTQPWTPPEAEPDGDRDVTRPPVEGAADADVPRGPTETDRPGRDADHEDADGIPRTDPPDAADATDGEGEAPRRPDPFVDDDAPVDPDHDDDRTDRDEEDENDAERR